MIETIVIYGSVEPDKHGRLSVPLEQEEGIKARTWVVLARLVDCPYGCSSGMVWGGDEPVSCPVCDGAVMVAVGFGGGYVERIRSMPIPEEPSESWEFADLRSVTLSEAPCP